MTADPARAGIARDVAVPLALLATAVGLRAALLLDGSAAPSSADARGLLADVACSAAFWVALLVVARWLRPAAWAGAGAPASQARSRRPATTPSSSSDRRSPTCSSSRPRPTTAW